MNSLRTKRCYRDETRQRFLSELEPYQRKQLKRIDRLTFWRCMPFLEEFKENRLGYERSIKEFKMKEDCVLRHCQGENAVPFIHGKMVEALKEDGITVVKELAEEARDSAGASYDARLVGLLERYSKRIAGLNFLETKLGLGFLRKNRRLELCNLVMDGTVGGLADVLEKQRLNVMTDRAFEATKHLGER